MKAEKMMKKKLMLAMLMLSAVMLFGCGKKVENVSLQKGIFAENYADNQNLLNY